MEASDDVFCANSTLREIKKKNHLVHNHTAKKPDVVGSGRFSGRCGRLNTYSQDILAVFLLFFIYHNLGLLTNTSAA